MTNARDDTIMEPPYEMNLMFRPSGDEARIRFTGTGWGRTWFRMNGPGKDLANMVEAEQMNNPFYYVMPAVGTWHFRVSDEHCTRIFDVVVKPKL